MTSGKETTKLAKSLGVLTFFVSAIFRTDCRGGKEERVSGDVIGGREEKNCCSRPKCTRSEATGPWIRTTLRFTRMRFATEVNCSKYSVLYGKKIQVASIKSALIIRPITP